jgi:sugar phosphate isomerase/epimerase
MRRRDFIQRSVVASAGVLALPSILQRCASSKSASTGKNWKDSIGLQLYTLRDTITKDPKGDLTKVASFGYKELETFGYRDGKIFGMPFAEFGKFTKDLGMKVTSGHYGLDILRSDGWEKAVTDAKAIGQEYMICPYIQDTDRKSLDDYKKICESLNKAGEVCNRNGIRFGYHNHAFEFETMEGKIPYDMMLAELDPKKVGMEMDIFWVVNAKQDPLAYFKKYPGRFEQWHVKDMDKNDRMRNADVGTGTIDWKSIFAQAKLSGMKHFYVEQETYPGVPIDSAAACAKYLKTIL